MALLNDKGVSTLWKKVKEIVSVKVDKELKTNSTTEYKTLSDNNLTDELIQKINNGTGSEFSGNYNDLKDIPDSFPPLTHNHDTADINDLEIPSMETINQAIEQANTAADTAAEAVETATSLLEDIASHTYAGSSTAGGPADSANKLNTDAGSTTQPVYFSGGVPVKTTYTLSKSVPSNAVFTDTNTHYTSKNVVGSATATSNTTSALTNGNVYINSVENGAVTSAHKISGSGATKVTTDTSGNIVISSTDNNTTYSAAGSSLGLVKSGGGVNISDGVITVNDDSHSHTIENIDNLKTTLDGSIKGLSVSGKTITYTKNNGTTGTITTQDTNTTYSAMTGASSSAAGTTGLVPAPASGKQASFLRGDGTWVVPTNTTYSNFVKSGSSAKAGLVPAPSTTAGTTKYLREDCTWATPPNTTYTLSSITGTLAVGKGGTGATTAAGALTNLGLTATATELNYCDGVTSSIQTQLNGKASSGHSHNYLPLSGGTINGNLTLSGILDESTETLNMSSSTEVTWLSDVPSQSGMTCTLVKKGKMCFLSAQINVAGVFTANTERQIFYLPARFLPKNKIFASGIIAGYNGAPKGNAYIYVTNVIDSSTNKVAVIATSSIDSPAPSFLYFNASWVTA